MKKHKFKIACVLGTRPNFVKMAPIVEELRKYSDEFSVSLIHTGQHYDPNLSDIFFKQLQLPEPNYHLGVSGSQPAQQIAEIISKFDELCGVEQFRLVLLVGDVNSTLACAVAAAHRKIPIAHVEAGLRSFDRTMPEEINRVVTDSISDLLFVSEPSGVQNLMQEGHQKDRIKLVGNVMIDSMLTYLSQAKNLAFWDQLGFKRKEYGVVTLHRPSNVDDFQRLKGILVELEAISDLIPLVFSVHPRTRRNLKTVKSSERFIFTEPLSYLDFLSLLEGAKLVITDSGGIQEETTALRVPCLTLRPNTERPITIEMGTNTLIGPDPKQLMVFVNNILSNQYKQGNVPLLWDGHASERIIKILSEEL